MRKRAFNVEELRQSLGHPAVLGTLMATQPKLLQGIVGATGGLGLSGLLDMIHHGGSNMGAFFKGPLAGRNPEAPAAPVAAPHGLNVPPAGGAIG